MTSWAKFASTDETVAKVDESGRLEVVGHGEAAINVWYASSVDHVTVTSPYETPIDPQNFASALGRNEIDVKNLAKLADVGHSDLA